MNEQEMQFADPDWQPDEQTYSQSDSAGSLQPGKAYIKNDFSGAGQKVGGSSYSSSKSTYSPYDQGYKGSSYQVPPYATPGSTSRRQTPAYQTRNASPRSLWWIWLIAIFVFILIISQINSTRQFHTFPGPPGGIPGQHHQFNRPGPGFPQGNTYFYTPASATAVQLNDPSGAIVIQTGDPTSDQITATTTDSQDNAVSFTEHNDVVTISLNNPVPGNNNDITVALPANITSLNLTTTEGDIEVDYYNGSLAANTNGGNITLNQDILSNKSTLSTVTGTINLQSSSIVGPATIASTSGTIILDAALSGQVTVQTGEDGYINFTGILDQHGTYQFTTDQGNLDLTLPASTSMQVTHTTATDWSYQSDFTDMTGASPQAVVHVKTNSGAISIHNQG